MPQAAGETILASDIIPVRYYQKLATESRTSVATPVNDADFANIPLAANKMYRVEAFLGVGGAVAADIATNWVLGGGVQSLVTTKHTRGPGLSGGDPRDDTQVRISVSNVTTTVTYGASPSGTGSIHEDFLVETTTSGTAGTITLQWWQAVSNATATTLISGSYLIITEIEPG
jgi:hypothetical protein